MLLDNPLYLVLVIIGKLVSQLSDLSFLKSELKSGCPSINFTLLSSLVLESSSSSFSYLIFVLASRAGHITFFGHPLVFVYCYDGSDVQLKFHREMGS